MFGLIELGVFFKIYMGFCFLKFKEYDYVFDIVVRFEIILMILRLVLSD